MTRRALRRPDEGGAILIHVAIALLVLIAFSAFAVDIGIMWVSRNQAQNAADAAALAAATSLAFDAPDDRDLATRAAQAVGAQNFVWGMAADIQPGDVTFPECPPGAPGPPDTCVRVNVFRNQVRHPLPTFFARLVGVESQGVQATATAQVLTQNQSDCVLPFAVPDKWEEHFPEPVVPWNPESEFDLFYPSGSQRGDPLPDPDVYIPPYTSGGELDPNTTGFRVEGASNDYGTELTLKVGNPQQTIAPGWFFPVDLPRADGAPITGGDKYRENIASCNGVSIGPGDILQNEPGNMIGPTAQGVEALIAQDPTAHWWDPDGPGGPERGTVVSEMGASSPRLVALPLFNVDVYERGRASGRVDLEVTNVLGFFIDRMEGNDVIGYLTHIPTTYRGGAVNREAAFLRTVILVR
ncbi:MAG: pilus assembly protein TadG-related protein [Vicinamibacterales bacterium]